MGKVRLTEVCHLYLDLFLTGTREGEGRADERICHLYVLVSDREMEGAEGE